MKTLPWDLISSGQHLFIKFEFSFAHPDYFTGVFSSVDAGINLFSQQLTINYEYISKLVILLLNYLS